MLVQCRERCTSYFEGRAGRSDVRAEALWKVDVPAKIRVFLWRLARHSLPTADVASYRNMANSNCCIFYGEPDSWNHSLIECIMARRGCLTEVLGTISRDEVKRAVVRLWAIWHARRKAIHEHVYQSPLSTHMFVERFISDLEQTIPQRVEKGGSKTRQPRRIPPPSGAMKVKVDAAVSKNTEIAAVAAVARDDGGVFQGSSAVAIACREEGLALASDLLLQRVRLASDCANVIGSIHGAEMEPTSPTSSVEISATTIICVPTQQSHDMVLCAPPHPLKPQGQT
ncbi:hypothetical protein BS78_04G016200 [Paspalum vaginatum]|nr:hypothetical protein BS78_04G016200 [Paspalum vaginatum]